MNRGTRERGERERVVRWRWLCNVERVWNREKSFNATAEEQVHSAHSGCHFFRLRIQRLTITVIIGIVSIAMVQTMANATRNQTPIYYYILVRFPYRYLNSLANKIRNLGTSRLVTTKLPRWNLVTLEKIAELVKSTRRSSLSNAQHSSIKCVHAYSFLVWSSPSYERFIIVRFTSIAFEEASRMLDWDCRTRGYRRKGEEKRRR